MKIWKKTISLVTAAAFAIGTAYFPVGIEKVNAAEKESISGDYVEGQVIVGYIDTDDMNLTAKQEKKSDKLLGDSEELMVCENVAVEDVDVAESKLTDEVVEEETVDKTIALVESDTKSTEEMIDEISKLPNVSSVEPNYIMTADVASEDEISETTETEKTEKSEEEPVEDTDDAYVEESALETAEAPLKSSQWAYNNGDEYNNPYGINVPDWDDSSNKNAEGTVVAVIDTGVDADHEDLDDVMWTKSQDSNVDSSELKAFGEHGISIINGKISTDTDDTFSHGTHCAGIIAAEWNNLGVSGAANGTKIMAIKVSNGRSMSTADIIEGYTYIKQAKAAGVNIVAVNNSWGGGADGASALKDAIKSAGAMEIVSVFASGNVDDKFIKAHPEGYNRGYDCDKEYNFGTFTGHFIPFYLNEDAECDKYVIVVNSNAKDGSLSTFSNYGVESTDVCAPGSDIKSTIPNSEYGEKSGTSMACPAVTGTVAIVAAMGKNLSAEKIAEIIKATVTDVDGFDDNCKYGGIVNVSNAVLEATKNIEIYDFNLEYDKAVYDGEAKKPKVTCSGLSSDKYSISYSGEDSEFKEPGTYKVTINGKDSYEGTVELEYQIIKATPKASLSSTYFIYNGGNKSVSVKVTDSKGNVLTNGTDYSLSGQTSGKLPGTYRVYVTMKGTAATRYNNSYADFRIAVQPTSFKKLSRGKKSFTVKVAKKSKSLVNGYQVRYSLYGSMAGAKVKAIGTKYNRISKRVAGLKKKRVYYVQVRAYKTIGKTKYYSDWSGKRAIQTK